MSRPARARAGAAAVALAVVLAPVTGLAAGARTLAYRSGGYAVTVTAPDPAQVASPARFAVRLSPSAGVGLRAIALPGFGTPSTPVRATVRPGAPGEFTVTATFPVRGGWTLALLLSTPAGEWQVDVPVTVAAPGAIPTWLGWAIGLSPLLVLAVFLGFQVRYAEGLARRGRGRAEG